MAVPLFTLPPELHLSILTHLDIPDLHSVSYTCHQLRTLAIDPLLHHYRLLNARCTLSVRLARRPELANLRTSRIYLTRPEATRQSLGRHFAALRLKRRLAGRPSVPDLVERGVLPARVGVAPGLVATVERLERERVKDVLRGWVVRRGESLEIAEREGWVDTAADGGKVRVRDLARKYKTRDRSEARDQRWGAGRRERYDPPRAKVLGLKRFYERLASGVTA